MNVPISTFPLVVRGAAGLQAVGDVAVGEVLQDSLGEGQRLHLVRGHGMTEDGSAQVAQAGNGAGRPPEPHVAVSGSAGTKETVGCAVGHQPIKREGKGRPPHPPKKTKKCTFRSTKINSNVLIRDINRHQCFHTQHIHFFKFMNSPI